MIDSDERSRFFIVRHGNTFASDEPVRRIGARIDLPLTDEGRDQCRRLGSFFARSGQVFSRAMCGPLRRTVESANLVLAAQTGPIPSLEIDDRLSEIDHGPDEGRLETEVRARLGEAVLERWDRAGCVPPGWIVDEAARGAFWRSLLANPIKGATLIVTSNGAARSALALLPAGQRPPSQKLRTAGFGIIAIDTRGSLQVKQWDKRVSSSIDAAG